MSRHLTSLNLHFFFSSINGFKNLQGCNKFKIKYDFEYESFHHTGHHWTCKVELLGRELRACDRYCLYWRFVKSTCLINSANSRTYLTLMTCQSPFGAAKSEIWRTWSWWSDHQSKLLVKGQERAEIYPRRYSLWTSTVCTKEWVQAIPFLVLFF